MHLQALAQHNGMLPSLDSVLSFLKHVAAGKVHPAACYKPKPRQNSAQSKRRSRNPDAEEYLPYGYNRATPARKKAKHMARHHPVSDAVALTISFRGTLSSCFPRQSTVVRTWGISLCNYTVVCHT